MTTPKREEPPFVSDDKIEQLTGKYIDGFESSPNRPIRAVAYMRGATDVQQLYEEERSRLRTEQEGKIKDILREVNGSIHHRYRAFVHTIAKKNGIDL